MVSAPTTGAAGTRRSAGDDLVLSKVSFSYRRRGPRVLADLSVGFPCGSTALLGVNGAGKSTLMGVAATLLVPQSGVVSVGGDRAHGHTMGAYRRRVGWMPQVIRPIGRFSARESVAYAGWLAGMDRTQAWEDAPRALGRVSLQEQEGTRASELSGGQLRRLGIAQALIHGSDWLLLDEPAAGLDPLQRSSVRDLFRELRDEVNLVVSTHVTADVIGGAFDHVVVLHRGAVLWQGSTEAFVDLAPPTGGQGERGDVAFTRLLEGS